MSLERLERFTKPRFLLCEGDDDKGFFEALIAGRQLPEFQICHSAQCNPEETGGKHGFSKSLRAKRWEVLSGWRDVKGILLATDNDKVGPAFAEAQKVLTDNGYVAPPNAAAVGNIAGKPTTILMIPGANVPGDLESLCLPAIHSTWPLAERCVTAFLQCTGANTWTKPGSINKSRARAAAVGFNEEDPYKGIGHLFRNRTLSVQHSCFDEIANFLSNFDAKCGI